MQRRRVNRSKKKLGQIPGSIIYTGERSKEDLFIESFDYNRQHCSEKTLHSIEESFEFKNTDAVTWVNLNGLNHVNAIEKLGQHFGFHPLVLEDVVNIAQRPKIDEHEGYLFVVLKMLYYNKENNLVSEQVSFLLGKNYLFSFQESEGDVFDAVRVRIRQDKGRIRSMASDYLLYSLIDAIVDHYFSVIEILGDKIEDYESAIFEGETDHDTSRKIQDLKREILRVRRSIFPLREVINKIEKNENPLIHKKTITYFRDVYDHLIQVTENIDIYREMILGLMDMYMTSISNKMNEVMKVLTIMASIFIPLTFIAGIYGMNFNYMPELQFKYGYFLVWGIMVIIFVGMLYYFKRKKWI
ncbi:magnesium/cobalt transporter CorA [Algibacter mikhailovii]|uniref:magnesium/cobalt transporter CorA n=1 Tax=Algibacter mikhailovii TaxID=425498 RepID=UPI002494D7B1|nr:magnesium/cobalt transporter CorA [Algibacter mikhailovii]